MELNEGICEVCGSNTWKIERGNWIRCQTCGFLDSTTSERTCQICNRPIGRFAKATLFLCIHCKIYTDIPIHDHCSTPFCGGKIRLKQKTENNHCDGCLYEMNYWKTPNGPKWKEAAVEIFKNPTRLKIAHEQLKTNFPELTQYKLAEWIKRHYLSGFIVRIKHGIYQVKEPET